MAARADLRDGPTRPYRRERRPDVRRCGEPPPASAGGSLTAWQVRRLARRPARRRRAEDPTQDETYLDANAGAPLRPEARDAVLAALDLLPGNPSSAHAAGRRARKVLGDAREAVAALVGARPNEIVFTSGATESNVRGLRGVLAAPDGPRTLVTSRAEHTSVLALAERLAEEGVEVLRAGVDRTGRFDAAEVAGLVPAAGAVVSLVAAQPVTGAIEPVAEAAAALRGRAGVVLHSDAAQAVGRIPVDVSALGVDLLSFSAHKLGGPPGIGALFVREGTRFRPADGGGSQELGRRGGTESFALAAGFGAAAVLAARDLRDGAERARGLLAPLRAFVESTPGGEVLTPADDALPNTLLLAFAGCAGETLLVLLDARGVRVSTGTACTSGARRPAEVLLAGGRAAADAARAVRVSTSWRTTAADVERLCAAIGDALPRARAAAAST